MNKRSSSSTVDAKATGKLTNVGVKGKWESSVNNVGLKHL